VQILCKFCANAYLSSSKKDLMEKQEVEVSIYLDTRRQKASGKYPVKVRIYHRQDNNRKYYPTEFDFTEQEFQSVWLTTKPRNEFKAVRQALQALETKACQTASSIQPFNFETFEKRLFIGGKESTNIFYHYEVIISDLKKEARLGNASNYDLSLKSIKAFEKASTGKEPKKMHFNQINVAWLNRYEKWMLKEGKSLTTVGIYLRHLRAVFNTAIEAKDIEPEVYPFGKRRYQIPAPKAVKKALNFDDLKKLFHSEAMTPEQQKAKDFFFFSYSCNGMNIKDIALLRYGNIEGNKLFFYRAKTINTSKGNLRKVEAFLTAPAKAIIEQYGNPNRKDEALVFDIINDRMTDDQQRRAIQAFTRFINQHLKKLAVKEGLTEDVSTYWARHSFATNAIRNGASMEQVSESLGHGNLQTTQGYFAGFSDKDKQQIAERLTAF
jgi:integrase/recombinase XerD